MAKYTASASPAASIKPSSSKVVEWNFPPSPSVEIGPPEPGVHSGDDLPVRDMLRKLTRCRKRCCTGCLTGYEDLEKCINHMSEDCSELHQTPLIEGAALFHRLIEQEESRQCEVGVGRRG